VRLHLIEIRTTPAGRSLFDRADEQVAGLDAELSGALSPAELKALKELLTRVTEAARRQGGTSG